MCSLSPHIPREPYLQGVVSAMERLHLACRESDETVSFVQVLSALYEIMAIIYNSAPREENEYQRLSKRAEFSRKVVEIVSTQYASPVSTASVAHSLHINESYFCRTFKAVFGHSFVDYLNQYRISVAKNLKSEDMTIAEISRSVGYENYDTFAIHFKRYTGKTPREYYKASSL